jgi:hypothetical protein
MSVISPNDVYDGALNGDSSIPWRVRRLVAELHPGQAIIDGIGGPFDLTRFASEGGCVARAVDGAQVQLETSWTRTGGVYRTPRNGAFDVEWNGARLRVYLVQWRESYRSVERSVVVAETLELAEAFVAAVNAHCNQPGAQVLRFNGGCWSRSAELYRTIQTASFDDLVLAGDQKAKIQADFTSFLRGREEYERYGVPWRRGVLFLGPPGNGKTHCVRAVLKMLEVPILFVQSLRAKYATDDATIEQVFQRAHEITPCCLVFEDLDAMINDGNRSVFLNHLDGLGHLSGVLTIATTNHAERLDPAIVDRPSRFDRKYHFALPALPERLAYLSAWNARLDVAMRIDTRALEELAERTSEFSFAYLKELYVSSMIRWMHDRGAEPMRSILEAQLTELRAQMHSGPAAARSPEPPAEGDDDDMP